jgi:hypothetical protein
LIAAGESVQKVRWEREIFETRSVRATPLQLKNILNLLSMVLTTTRSIDRVIFKENNENEVMVSKVGKLKTDLMALLAVTLLLSVSLRAQQIVDKTVAVVSDSARLELITYSDLLWQLALQPGTPLEPPRSEDLNQALQLLINQRLFALEARRLPRVEPTDAEINQKINEIIAYFPSPAVFEARLKTVGFGSVRDEGFQQIIARRLAIDKYVDFRFGSFIVVSADEEANYYRDVFVPNFRRKSPGQIVPTLDEQRRNINQTLAEQKKAAGIERFLDEAKHHTEVEILIEV